MKRFGFTLSEVLITLAIIGVVAALTMPTLLSDTVGAQIGPKLAKAVSAIEQANMALLDSQHVDSLTETDISNASDYMSKLSNYMKGTVSGKTITSKDGMLYTLESDFSDSGVSVPYKNKVGDIIIDINGSNSPNADAEDIFYFALFADGSLRPRGAHEWDGSSNATTWRDTCKGGDVDDATYCAGSIFENNLKVLYK